ncbi:hypothetical protein [Accumulibacter sp.]|uniref:hypothetical protein n=1 Tax=Accumulibacter sp. TaxID=2053492 RepID=UPI0025FC9326|nr:hypothetical protein [Accumulibacter sp.]MCP5229989.1 hypothetical protein [Accumulibacter sp.]
MNKLAGLVAGGFLLCGAVGAATAGSRCEQVTGTLKLDMPLTPQDTMQACADFQATRRLERYFDDTVFVYDLPPAYWPSSPICFSGTISGLKLDGKEVQATSLSALTVNRFAGDPSTGTPPPDIPAPGTGLSLFTAATVVTLSTEKGHKKDKELGSLFLRDTGLQGIGPFSFPPAPAPALGPYAVEQLIGVGGTKKFSNASVSMEIIGYEFAGAPVTGTICR